MDQIAPAFANTTMIALTSRPGNRPVLYRILHFINEWFALAVFGAYVIAFLVALSMMFVFPQITLLLFFLGLAGLGFAVMASRIVNALSLALARHALASGACPFCRQPGDHVFSEDDTWRCEHCSAVFQRSGTVILPQSNAAVGTDAS